MVFAYKRIIYKQMDGMEMGSRLAPVFPNIFMEWFEQRVVETSNTKPTTWFRYVDYTFVQWQHGIKKTRTITTYTRTYNPHENGTKTTIAIFGRVNHKNTK